MSEKPKINKWILLILLFSVAAFMYGSIMLKTHSGI